jgi:peptide/nickel transport system substrate-binding protein
MTADDVVWSMKRFLTLGTGRAYVLVPFVQDVVALNATTVKFTLKSTFGPFISALPTFYILNSDLVAQHLKAGGQYGTFGDYGKEWLTTHDAGSGAYFVKDFNPAAKLVLQMHKTYFGGFNAKSPDYVEMIGTTEAMTVRTMIANGELELTDNWQTRENLQAIKQIPDVTIAASMDISGGWYLMMDTKKAPTDDVHIRRALAYAFDYQKLTTTLFPDTVQMRGPVNSQLLGYDSSVFQFTRDLVKAKAELALSKYAANFTKYTITLHWCAEVPDEEKGALLFSTNAAEIGLNVQVVKTPWTSMVQESSSLETKPNIEYISAGADYPEAGSILMNRYHSKQALTWWQNEALLNTTLDAEMENALKTVDFNQRMTIYKQIQKELVNQCPSIFMFQAINWRAFPNYVTVPYVKYGKFQLTGSLGNVYSYSGSSGTEFRLFEINKLITYAG